MSNQPAYLRYIDLESRDGSKSPYRIACMVLNRPQQANCFNGEMLDCLVEKLKEVKDDKSVRLLLFQGEGKHFSAGADLNWMKQSAAMSYEENLHESTKLTDMFETLSYMEIPTVAIVQGGTYGGGVGIVACCDFAIASDEAKFCLSEAKIGLIPAVVLPYLNRKTACGQLRRHILGGRPFSAAEAKDFGLVQVTSSKPDLEKAVREEVNQLLVASPEAQGSYKRLQKYLSNHSYQQGPYTAAAIAIARASDFGQSGLNAFLEKKDAPWICRLPETEPIVQG